MDRCYESLLSDHFADNRQMAFLAGPRQVGKTTTSVAFSRDGSCFNWDDEDRRRLILDGPSAVAGEIGLSESRVVLFDEFHKYPEWKNFLKGFFDIHADHRLHVVVTGSARLDLYRKGADSLMGRYFLYRMHPLSVAEIASPRTPGSETRDPAQIDSEDFDALLRFGGFPEPYLRRNTSFHNRWKLTRSKLLFREEMRDIARVHEVGRLEVLAELLRAQSGQLVNHASLARKIRVSENTVRRWITIFESLYYCFLVCPWSRNVPRSLLKNPKVYLWDWSVLIDQGARNENFVASHLLKAVHWWQDTGLGEYGLFYLRTKEGQEVDFVVTRNGEPWFIVEAKSSMNQPLSRNLVYFQKRIGVRHAFQVVMDTDFVDADPFEITEPVRVPALTLLSQLV